MRRVLLFLLTICILTTATIGLSACGPDHSDGEDSPRTILAPPSLPPVPDVVFARTDLAED